MSKKVEYKKVELSKNRGSIWVLDNDLIGWHIDKTKTYFEESELLVLLKNILKKGLVIYDIGGNIGNHSLFFSRELKAKKIYTFEPVPFIFECLQKNATLVSNITTFNMGLGEGTSYLDLYIQKDYDFLANVGVGNNYGGYGPYGDENTRILESKARVKMVSLDEFSLKNKFRRRMSPPDFMKIDVEGHELQVLKGAKKTILTYKPIICLESFSGAYDAVNSYLESLGYIKLMSLPANNYLYVNPKSIKLANKLPAWLRKIKRKINLFKNRKR